MKNVTIIYWGENTDIERIDAWIQKLLKAGHADHAVTQNYNPETDCPTLYFP